ncbi:energy transducer TonB [Silvibacterium acidisoli]|uniref:energy transducer TonB n=1 Tax=Acidobacteriaceae bacterium ZG23-2 TaxID=2883246 RepID=UPI00406D252D
MIRPLLTFALFSLSASFVASAQTPDPSAASQAPTIACPADGNLPPQLPSPNGPRKLIPVSAGVAAQFKKKGEAPAYPPNARQAYVEGTVVLHAIISPSGDVESLCVIQGPEMLQQAAYDAVKTWKYKPYKLNGEKIGMDTQINVAFKLR